MTYAKDTQVSTQKSRVEIERTLERYGADSFAFGWDQTQAAVSFRLEARQYRLTVPAVDERSDDIIRTPTGRARTSAQIREQVAQADRQRWRALALVIKAKLEAVEAGISTVESEFLAHVVLPSGETMGEWSGAQIERAYSTGGMPTFLALGPGD